MKRSKMIEILGNSFAINSNCYGDCSDEAIYDRVLKDLENVGMLPPFSSKAASKSDNIDAAGYEWDVE